MSRFVMVGDVETTGFDWGTAGMRCAPPGTGCTSGRVTQRLSDEHTEPGPGDSVYIDKDIVRGSYNDFDEAAELQVVLAPAVTDGGYVAVDVSGEEPWASLRS